MHLWQALPARFGLQRVNGRKRFHRMSQDENATKGVRIRRSTTEGNEFMEDVLAVEEPLEIRLAYRGKNGAPVSRGVSITMRTPGDDESLAAGFLATEGMLDSPDDLDQISIGSGEDVSGLGLAPNVAKVALGAGRTIDLEQLSRHVFTSSSCGVCGKATLEALVARGLGKIEGDEFRITSDKLRSLPVKLLEWQKNFAETGGLHATGLVTTDGLITRIAEDVGRHNAMDKLLGRCFLEGEWPLSNYLLLVSGRASFELIQKALVAGVPMLAAVGAPSSLAVELADSFGLTLVGFLSDKRFNVYCNPDRVIG
jgi:FdhD protein